MDEKIISKIKKLFELGASSNPHEADLAMQRAGEMMAKYNIDFATIHEHGKNSGDAIFDRGVEMIDGDSYWELSLACNIARNFECSGLRSMGKVIIIGYKSDLDIVEFFFKFVRREIYCTMDMVLNLKTNKKRFSYAMGFVETITSRLADMYKAKEKVMADCNCTALVLKKKDAVDLKVKEMFPNLGKVRNNQKIDYNHFSKGKSDGQKTRLNRAVSNTGRARQAIA